jgi:hypothetical protein
MKFEQNSLVSNLVLPPSAFSGRPVPEWFAVKLAAIDPALICYYNHLRDRWIIDRCTRGVTAENLRGENKHEHTNDCPRTNVRVVQDAQGNYMPLCQEVLDWFHQHDIGSQFKNQEAYINHLAAKWLADDEKRRADRRSNTRHATLDGKRQLLQAFHLMQQHDLELNQ